MPLKKKPNVDSGVLTNYRPISLLPAKMLEKIVQRQLAKFIESHNILHDTQSGFRAGFSTETALLEVADSVRIAVDSGASSMLVLLDLSAAFDMVDHDILVRRLQDSRISGAALAWMKSFLYKRTQRVALQPYQSEQKHLWCGVPQGSALSPLLLNIYLAPLFTLIAN